MQETLKQRQKHREDTKKTGLILDSREQIMDSLNPSSENGI